MNKKAVIALVLAAVLGMGASAQMVLGVSGALYTQADQLSAKEIKAAFDDGTAIYWGPFGELIFGKIGIGGSVNFQSHPNNIPADTDVDYAGFLSYHLFGGGAFLDPFAELGGGMLANSKATSFSEIFSAEFNTASYYWFAALGAGIKIGPIGLFGKFAWDFAIKEPVPYVDTNGDKQSYFPYGYDYLTSEGYIPNLRFTAGVKLIL